MISRWPAVLASTPIGGERGLDELMGRVAGRFARVESRRRVREFLVDLLSGVPRVNRWTVAEQVGDGNPDGMQHLLARACWDHDGAMEDLRAYVTGHLAQDDGVLVVDETGDVKKSTATVGVQRQYTGTAGRIENSQVAVYLVYARARGHASIDRELYLPRSWTDDQARYAAAGSGAVEPSTAPRSKPSTRGAARGRPR